MRRCKKCGLDKPLTAFPKSPRRGGCRLSVCRWCVIPLRTCDWCGKSTREHRRCRDGGYECRRESSCAAPRFPRRGTLVRLGVPHVLKQIEQHAYNLSAAARALGVGNTSLGRFLRSRAPQAFAALRRENKVRRGNHLPGGTIPWIFDDPAALIRITQQHKGRMIAVAVHTGCSVDTVRRSLQRLAPELYARLKTRGRKFFDDPALLTRLIQRHDGCIKEAAAAAGCSEWTIRHSLRRLTPELYAQIVQQRHERSALAERRRHRPKLDPARHPWRLADSRRKAA